jgi:hypothetical protein
MCYHYSLKAKKSELEDRYKAELNAEYEAIYHNDGFAHMRCRSLLLMSQIKYNFLTGD